MRFVICQTNRSVSLGQSGPDTKGMARLFVLNSMRISGQHSLGECLRHNKRAETNKGDQRGFFSLFFNKQEQTTLFCTTAANGDLSFPKKYEYLDLCVHNTYTYLLSCGDKTLFYGDLVR